MKAITLIFITGDGVFLPGAKISMGIEIKFFPIKELSLADKPIARRLLNVQLGSVPIQLEKLDDYLRATGFFRTYVNTPWLEDARLFGAVFGRYDVSSIVLRKIYREQCNFDHDAFEEVVSKNIPSGAARLFTP